MSASRPTSVENTNAFDLDPWEEKAMIGSMISLVAFGVLGGIVAALAVTGNLMKFLEWKANLTIGQGLLYIALPISITGTVTIIAVKNKKYCSY